MSEHNPSDEEIFRDVNYVFKAIIFTLIITFAIPLTLVYQALVPGKKASVTNDAVPAFHDSNAIHNGKDAQTGLVAEGNYLLVKSTCTACHSSDLILQSGFNRETWVEKIRWMQRTQKLWDLGQSEDPILDYLEKYYGPDSVMVAFRKPPLQDIQWYVLKD